MAHTESRCKEHASSEKDRRHRIYTERVDSAKISLASSGRARGAVQDCTTSKYRCQIIELQAMHILPLPRARWIGVAVSYIVALRIDCYQGLLVLSLRRLYTTRIESFCVFQRLCSPFPPIRRRLKWRLLLWTRLPAWLSCC